MAQHCIKCRKARKTKSGLCKVCRPRPAAEHKSWCNVYNDEPPFTCDCEGEYKPKKQNHAQK